METQTLGRVLRDTVVRYGAHPAYLSVGKDGVSTLTYNDLYERVRGYAGLLVDLGLRRGDRIVLFAENSQEWMMLDLACQCLGGVVVPIYPTLPSDQASYIVQDCGAKLVVCGSNELYRRLDDIEGIERHLLKGENSLDAKSKTASMSHEALEREIDIASAEDPFTIIYTSGTTGKPKGAVMPHRAFVHVCQTAIREIAITHEDRFMTFLPMSHVLERIEQYLVISLGASTCISKSLMALSNEMKVVSPTIMFTVPRFLENVKDKIQDAVAREKPIKQKLFAMMLDQGLKKYRGQFAPLAGLLDNLVASKIRERVGGKLRYFVSGGAALPVSVAEFFFAAGMTIIQGYGLTETGGGTCVNRPTNNKYWTVGEPLDMDVKIADDGEILMRGQGMMLGYFNLPEATAEAVDSEGWFHTGDIGEFEGKHLKITDRKKDIIVLGNGKNVAPQPIENQLKESPFITEAVVLGDGLDHCVALIVPNSEAVRHAIGLPDDADVTKSDGTKSLIKQEVDRINRSLAGFEMVKRHALLDHAFTIEGGELTPTLKVKRKVVKERYADIVKSLA